MNDRSFGQRRCSEVVHIRDDCLCKINILEKGLSGFSYPNTESKSVMMSDFRSRLWSGDMCQRRSTDGELQLRDLCSGTARQWGFIVDEELEEVMASSHRSIVKNTPGRILCSFKDRYGQLDSDHKNMYLQIGVRVPTKEHVSEIVGRQGSKIKQIREKTGALITTPGENEDHVFIIEAPPKTALHVAQIIRDRAEDITKSRSHDNRRRSSCPIGTVNLHHNKAFGQSNAKHILASGRIQVPKNIVGKIIGTQGSIITTIQRDTGTEIKSPPKDPGKHKQAMADFEILVYQTANLTDTHEAKHRIANAKQLIAHVTMHQLEKVRAEEAPYLNYQTQSTSNCDIIRNDHSITERMSHDSRKEQTKPLDWMWLDIKKLEDCVAQEVVERILEESKKKTQARSEPLIYDTISTNLYNPNESDSLWHLGSTLCRPRHSLPETNAIIIPGTSSHIQPQFPYQVNYNLPTMDFYSELSNFPGLSLINSRDPVLRSVVGEQYGMDLQSHGLMDNIDCNIVPECSVVTSRDMYMQNMFLLQAALDVDEIGVFKSPQKYHKFHENNTHWSITPQNGHTTLSVNCESYPSQKSYADSVRTSNIATLHGVIGDHLKKELTHTQRS